MELRQLGTRGPWVSPIGLGSTKFGRLEGVKYPQAFTLPSDGQLTDLLALAKEWGINLVDTAPAYGNSEARIGALIGRDDHWRMATKVGETFVDGRSHFDFSPAAIRASVEHSRRLLRRDVLDIVLLHMPDDDVAIMQDGAAITMLLELREQGLITAVGASTKNLAAGLMAVEHCDLVMITLNPSDQSQRPVLAAARNAGKGILIKKPLDSGYHSDVDVALASLVREPGVGSVVVGTIDPVHLAGNCAAVQRALADG
ncbi:MAG: aldo/keto reductase [Proteobacteria bacterium]|nr:aldo/keto reductase [Pseudomonadota bacterium]